jgi:peptidoglycan pentaglycine glycine transferase (the first glycine)
MIIEEMAEEVSVVRGDPEGARSWDHFLSRCGFEHFEQTTAWGRLKQCYGWTSTCFLITRGERIIGGAMILTRRIGRFATIGFVDRGPVWDPSVANSVTLVTRAFAEITASMRLDYVAVVPPYCGEQAAELLKSLHFRRKPDALPPTGVGQATLLIDLRKDVSALLADMSMTKRQNLRRASRKGVRVRIGDGADTEIVRELMWAACGRRGITPAPPQRDYFENLWRVLGPIGAVKFFIAEIDGQPVSAATAFVIGGTMQLWRVGWSGTHDRSNPNDLLHWEMMKWGKENGCHVFDFLHIRADHARAILNGERVKDSYSGVTDFKTSFGGQIRLLPELCYRSYNPALQFFLKTGGERIVKRGVFHGLLKRALSRP